MRLDDWNYENDSRVQGGIRRNQKVETVVMYNDETGDEEEIHLPTHKIVCPTCSGKGHHVNPSIDANGLSSDDFDADPDFREDYFGGAYDVQCYECGGKNVVDAVDMEKLERTNKPLYDRYMKHLSFEQQWRAEEAHERRMGY